MKIDAYSKLIIVNQLFFIAFISFIVINNFYHLTEYLKDYNYLISILLMDLVPIAVMLFVFIYNEKARANFSDRDKRQASIAKRRLWREFQSRPSPSISELITLCALMLVLVLGQRIEVNATQVAAICLAIYLIVALIKTFLYILYVNKPKPWYHDIKFEAKDQNKSD